MFRPRPRMTLLGLVLLAGVAILVERLVVTDAEAIEGLLVDMRKAVAQRQLSAWRPILDDEFRWQGLDADATVRRLQGHLDRNRPTSIDVTWGPVEPRGDTCIVEADARVLAYGGLFTYHGRLTFVRTSGGWKLREAVGP